MREIEEKERQRWVAAAVHILVRDGYPIAAMASKSSDPDAVLRRALGGRRASTLRRRVRTWRRVRAWLLASGYPVVPLGDTGAAHMAEYLNELATGSCALTTPKYVRAALGFFASCGGISPSERTSDHVLVSGTVKDLERELGLRTCTEVRKAPHYPVRVVASLEAAVVSPDLPLYKRVLAWYKLIRLWGGLRFDDSLHVRPEEVKVDDRALSLRIDSSKVSGPGQRVKVLYAFVSREAYLAHPGWLQEGHRLFGELARHVQRDYMIPLPTSDFESVRRGPALYADMLAMTRALLRELRRGPDADENPDVDCWEQPLLEAELVGFWSEHGDRAQLVSWAACCGIGQVSRDALGRWRAGTSDEYIRTSKALVLEAQGVVARTIRERHGRQDPIGEETLLEAIGSYLKGRSLSDECVSDQLRRLRYFSEGSAAPALVEPAIRPEEASDSADEAVMSLPYFVVVTRRAGIRRLHRRGGCSTHPGVGAPHFEEFAELPGPSQYTAVCKTCWKEGVVRDVAPQSEDSDGSSGASESSSSAPTSGTD